MSQCGATPKGGFYFSEEKEGIISEGFVEKELGLGSEGGGS